MVLDHHHDAMPAMSHDQKMAIAMAWAEEYASKYKIACPVTSPVEARQRGSSLTFRLPRKPVGSLERLPVCFPEPFAEDATLQMSDEERKMVATLFERADERSDDIGWPHAPHAAITAARNAAEEPLVSVFFPDDTRERTRRYIERLKLLQRNIPLQHPAILPAVDFPPYDPYAIFKDDEKLVLRRSDVDKIKRIQSAHSEEKAADVDDKLRQQIAKLYAIDYALLAASSAKQSLESDLLPLPHSKGKQGLAWEIYRRGAASTLHFDKGQLASYLGDELASPSADKAPAPETRSSSRTTSISDKRWPKSPVNKRERLLRKLPRDMYAGKRSIPLLDPPHCLVGTADLFRLRVLHSRLKPVTCKVGKRVKKAVEKQLYGKDAVGVDTRIVATAKRMLQRVKEDAKRSDVAPPQWSLIEVPAKKLDAAYEKLERAGQIHELQRSIIEPYYAHSNRSAAFLSMQSQFEEAAQQIGELKELIRTPRPTDILMPMDNLIVIDDDDGPHDVNEDRADTIMGDYSAQLRRSAMIAASSSALPSDDEQMQPAAPTSQTSAPPFYPHGELSPCLGAHLEESETIVTLDIGSDYMSNAHRSDSAGMPPISQKRFEQLRREQIQTDLELAKSLNLVPSDDSYDACMALPPACANGDEKARREQIQSDFKLAQALYLAPSGDSYDSIVHSSPLRAVEEKAESIDEPDLSMDAAMSILE